MNDKKKKALLESLSKDRQIQDDYLEKRPRRIIFMVIILLLIIGLVIIINITGKEKKKEITDLYENDNTKLFSKNFIDAVRYGFFVGEQGNKLYNCGYEKEIVDKLTKECLENEHLNKCSKFDNDKQYCFSFIKGNIDNVESLNFTNPKSIKELKEFSNIKSVIIDLNKDYKDYQSLFKEIKDLTEIKSNTSFYIFINDYTDELFKIEDKVTDNYKNINICLFDKVVCRTSGLFASYQDINKVISTFKGIKKDLNEEFENPSDLEKTLFIYSYMINNLKIDSKATLNEDSISRENMKDILSRKLVSFLALNEVGTYYSLTNYFDALAKYNGLKTNIGVYIDNSTKKEYIYNEVYISGKWYNLSIEKEISNLNDESKKYNYLLKSNDEFKANLNATIKNEKESNTSFDIDKIDSVISKIR